MEYDRELSLRASTVTTCTVDIQLLVNETEEVHCIFWDHTVFDNCTVRQLWLGCVCWCAWEIHSYWSFLGLLPFVFASQVVPIQS